MKHSIEVDHKHYKLVQSLEQATAAINKEKKKRWHKDEKHDLL